MPEQLSQTHSLRSIGDSVLIQYHDRPYKLRNHLPFAVDYSNNSLQEGGQSKHPGAAGRPKTASVKLSSRNPKAQGQAGDNSQSTDPNQEGRNQPHDAAKAQASHAGPKQNDAANPAGDYTDTYPQQNYTSSSKRITLKDMQKNPPIYREEDVAGLYIKGTNVYHSEKKHFMNLLDDLLTHE